MNCTNSPDPIVIWPFETVQGGCRLSLQVPREHVQELRAELWGCSVVAETFQEFISLAARAIARAGGTLGDVLRQPVPTPPLAVKVRAAARVSDVNRAAEYLTKSFRSASPEEAAAFWSEPNDSVLRAYIASVAHSLDEGRGEFIREIAVAVGHDPAVVEDDLEQAIADT
jgi:hypothetical protein